MSILTTAGDIRNDGLHMAGELENSDSEFFSKALDYLNIAHRNVLSGATDLDVECGEPWIWARASSPGILTILPKETLTVSITGGATAVTLSATHAASLAGYFMRVQGKPEFYRVLSHTAASASLTLDGPFNESTVAAVSADFIKLEYTLSSSILRLVSPMRVFRTDSRGPRSGQVEGIDLLALDRDFPLHMMVEGIPDRFAQVLQTASGIKIRFNRVPSVATRLEYEYIPNPSDLILTDTPLIPIQHRKVLSYMVAYQILHDKNDTRKDEYRALAQAALKALAKAYRRSKSNTSSQYGRLIPRRDLMGRRR